MAQECVVVSKKWGRIVKGQQEVGQECEIFSRKLKLCVTDSAKIVTVM